MLKSNVSECNCHKTEKSAWENWCKDVLNMKKDCKEGWHIVSKKDGSSVLTISVSAKISALFTVTLTTRTRHLSLPWCLCMFLCGCVRCVWMSMWVRVCFAHHSDINWTEAVLNSKRALPDNENSSCSFTLSLPSPIKMEQKRKKKMILKVTWLHPPLFCHLTKIHHHSTTNSSLSLFPLVCFDENRQLITEENSITCSHVRAYTHTLTHIQTYKLSEKCT